jgi:hypothetical protein
MNENLKSLDTAFGNLVIEGNQDLLPLEEAATIACFAVTGEEFELAINFFTYLAQAISNNFSFAFINSDISDSDLDEFKDGTNDCSLILFPFFIKKSEIINDIDLDKIFKVYNELSYSKNSICVFFDNITMENKFSSDTKIIANGLSMEHVAATVMALSGRESFKNLNMYEN